MVETLLRLRKRQFDADAIDCQVEYDSISELQRESISERSRKELDISRKIIVYSMRLEHENTKEMA